MKLPYLVHFTHISNLEGILEDGLLSRDSVDKLESSVRTNDESRHDNRTNTISLSIAHPNDLMFYKYRDVDADWCLIIVDISVLWKKDSLFCKYNAADARMSNLSDDHLSTPDSLLSMFDELDDVGSRSDQCLKEFDPTDKQAEILVFDKIAPKYIEGVVFSNRQVKKEHKNILGDKKSAIHSPNKGLYATRLYRRKLQ